MKKDRSLAKLFLLTTLLIGLFIYSTELLRKGVTVDIFDYAVSITIFIYPVTFYIANLITRQFEAVDTIRAIVIAAVVQFGLYWLGYSETGFALVVASTMAFVIAQAANLAVAEDLIKRSSNRYVDWFMLYVLIFILDNIIYIVVINNYVDVDFLSATLLLTFVVKSIVASVLGLGEVLDLRKKK